MMQPISLHDPAKRGFTLLELLVVIAIVAIMVGLIAGPVSGALRGFQLSQAGQELRDLLAQARMSALAGNRLVEVRFLQGTDDDEFTSVAIMELSPEGDRTLSQRIFRLPPEIIFSSEDDLSTLLDQSNGNVMEPLPGLGGNYIYRSFQFRPDGSTDLQWSLDPNNPERHFVTIHFQNDRENPPNNFFVVEVDALNGVIRSYRP